MSRSLAATKDFPIGDVLSAATGVLVSQNGIKGVYEVLNWMTGESVYTHQIPRISREAAPVILAKHPLLKKAYEEAKLVNRDNWQSWLHTWTKRYGETIQVPQFTGDQHKSLDPVAELAARVGPEKVIVLNAGKV